MAELLWWVMIYTFGVIGLAVLVTPLSDELRWWEFAPMVLLWPVSIVICGIVTVVLLVARTWKAAMEAQG